MTWDMLRSWTQIDIQKLTGDKINSPANAIYMSEDDHQAFCNLEFYFDKDTVSLEVRILMFSFADGLF